MQDSEKKTPENTTAKIGKHGAAVAEPVQEDVLTEDMEIMGDEGEIPLRIRKKKKSSGKEDGKEPDKKKNKKSSKKKKKGKKAKNAAAQLFSDKKFRRKKSLFEIMSATGEESLIKPIYIFGHEIRFWPLFLFIFVFLLVGVIVISNGNITPLNEEITVVGLPDDLEGYKVLVISDMNSKRFGDEQSSLVRSVENLDYDIILCVGDMVGKSGDAEPFYEFLDGLSHPEDVYFICGDADPGPFVNVAREIQGTLPQLVLEDWILGAVERGANYVDAPQRIEVGENAIWLTPTGYLNKEASSFREEWKEQMRQEEDGVIAGIATDYNSLPFTSYRYEQAQRYYEAVNSITASDLLIGMSHIVPDDAFIRSAALHDTDNGRYMYEPELIVSGHYCGGVWKLPVLGAFYAPNRMLPRYGWFPAKEDVNGLSRVGESQIYITGGLSTTSAIPLLPFRLLNEPEVSVLSFTGNIQESMVDMP